MKKVDQKTVNSKQKKTKETGKTSELHEQVAKAREDLRTLRMDHKMGKLKNTSSLTLKRKEIARMLTALRQVELQHEENA